MFKNYYFILSDSIHQLLFFIILFFFFITVNITTSISNLFQNILKIITNFFIDIYNIYSSILNLFFSKMNTYYMSFGIYILNIIAQFFKILILISNLFNRFFFTSFVSCSKNTSSIMKKKILYYNFKYYSRNFVRYYSTSSSNFWFNNEFNYNNYKNPSLILDDFYIHSNIPSISSFEEYKKNSFRYNKLKGKKVPVDSYGIDILENIIFHGFEIYKLRKLLSFRIFLYEFPAGTSEYLKLNKNTNIQDLDLDMRFGLLYYHFLISEMQKNKLLFDLLKEKFHFNEDFFSIELIDFCIQKWSFFSNSKKITFKNNTIKYDYNALGKAIGLDIKNNYLKESESSILNTHLDFYTETFFKIDENDYTQLLHEIDIFLENKH